MANKLLEITLDYTQLIKDYEELADQIEPLIDEEIAKLSAQTHAHIIELANQKLHSNKQLFLENFPAPEQIDDKTWLITIPPKLMWIEEGIESGFDMKEGMLASPKAKTNKEGEKYFVVPFKQGKGSNQHTMVQAALAKTIKQELSKRNINYSKIEKNPDGSPKLGLLHKIDLAKPESKSRTMPGFEGPSGRHFQSNPRPGGHEGPGGRPYLHGIRIYQNEIQKPGGRNVVERSIMTFRTVKEDQADKWLHPGISGQNFINEAAGWAEEQLDVIMDTVMQKIGVK